MDPVMDNFIDVFAQRIIGNDKYARTVQAVEKSMNQYGTTRPLTIECKNVLSDLPDTPKKREDEILRQLRSSKFPKTEHEVANKLFDLYVYSDVGKSLESDAITLAIMKSLKVIENEIPPPGKRCFKVAPQILKNDSRNTKKKISSTMEVEERRRKDIDKYSQVGEIKRKLYSMPDYVRNRDKKGGKLPENKLKSPLHHVNLNISKVRGLNTKMGRVIVRQEAERKKNIQDLTQKLNSYSKKVKII